jgi:hypothetical protein
MFLTRDCLQPEFANSEEQFIVSACCGNPFGISHLLASLLMLFVRLVPGSWGNPRCLRWLRDFGSFLVRIGGVGGIRDVVGEQRMSHRTAPNRAEPRRTAPIRADPRRSAPIRADPTVFTVETTPNRAKPRRTTPNRAEPRQKRVIATQSAIPPNS